MGDAKRNELENLWASRLQDARLRLEFAANYLKEVQGDIEADSVSVADGNFAFEKAVRAENSALAEYNRVLRIYTDLTVSGIIPDEG
jgi:hypothetical protein